MPPVDPSNGCLSMFPGFGNVGVRSGQQMAYATRTGIFVSSLEFQVGTCLYVTAAVKAASHFGRAQGDQSGQRFIGTCRELSPPPFPFPSPFLSLLLGAFLNGILRIAPFFLWCVPGRLFVAGNTCLFSFFSSPFLSLSLSSLPTPPSCQDLSLGCY